ncbi:Uncharacterised protein [Citrobacter koseri]|uniref:Uncharacterized protein n=1 Tax=Citrobacter koseri TaxID=545 RepID=A0A2X2W0P5_CITKO|nr:Uncharacterised protein [Citrobacter koseri]
MLLAKRKELVANIITQPTKAAMNNNIIIFTDILAE